MRVIRMENKGSLFLSLVLLSMVWCQVVPHERKPLNQNHRVKRSEPQTQAYAPPIITKVQTYPHSINIAWKSDTYTYKTELLYGITANQLKVTQVPLVDRSYTLRLLEPGMTYIVTLRVFHNIRGSDSVSRYITTLPLVPKGEDDKVIEVNLKIVGIRRSLTDGLFGKELLRRYIHQQFNSFGKLRTGVRNFEVVGTKQLSSRSWLAFVNFIVNKNVNIAQIFNTFLALVQSGRQNGLTFSHEQFSFEVYAECCTPLLHKSFDIGENDALYPLSLTALRQDVVEGQCNRGLDLRNTDIFINGQITSSLRDVTVCSFVKVVDERSLNPIFSSVSKSGQIRLEILGGKLIWMMYNPESSQGFVLTTLRQIKARRWYHVAASFSEDSGVAKVFVDGILQSTETSSVRLNLEWWKSPHFGKYYSGAFVYRLNGILDEVYLFPCLLPMKEIKSMAEGCFSSSCQSSGVIEGPKAKGLGKKQDNTCFCAETGMSNDCQEMFLFPSAIQLGSLTESGRRRFSLVTISPDGVFTEESSKVRIDFSKPQLVATITTGHNKVYYWKLSPEFLGNKLSSYGRRLFYVLEYSGRKSSQAIATRSKPDIIIEGSDGHRIYLANDTPLSSGEKKEVFLEKGRWMYQTGRVASKNDIMKTLLAIRNIFIRADYGKGSQELRLNSVTMETRSTKRTSVSDQAERFLKCKCRNGKRGIACELIKQVYKWCNTAGSDSEQPNPIPLTERCICKTNVRGDLCNQCKEGTFHLDAENPVGCTPCFCNGLANVCESAKLTKSQISINAQDINNLGFGSSDKRARHRDHLVYNPLTNSVTFEGFSRQMTNDVFYWELPLRYCGDKLRSYGGLLRYTVSYVSRPADQPIQGPDVILTGNGITLHYAENGEPPAVTKYYYSVILDEKFWKLPYGGPVKREEMIMALVKIESILLRATFSTEMVATSLYDVTLDVATFDSLTSSRVAAPMVEECRCPKAYFGLSCQYCNKGYRKRAGSYLGRCIPCFCNGFSDDCDGESGTCKNCRRNTNGTYCEKCKEGFYGDPTTRKSDACKPCPCPLTTPSNQFSKSCFVDKDGEPTCTKCPKGYGGRRCDRCVFPYSGNPKIPGESCQLVKKSDCDHCDKKGSVKKVCSTATRQCLCKKNVKGIKCNQCKDGYFYLNATNKHGCINCFCSGVTNICTSGFHFTQRHNLRWSEGRLKVTNVDGRVMKDEEVYKGREDNEFILGGVHSGDGILYWSLPKAFVGSQVTAYRGKIGFKISYDTRPNSKAFTEKDIIIKGNNMIIHYKHGILVKVRRTHEVQVPLAENYWFRENGKVAERYDLMTILSNVEYILIRASYSIETSYTSISDIFVEKGVNYYTRFGQALWVERCQCPQGFSGSSCESCSRGYTQIIDAEGNHHCRRCNCNRHSLECDSVTGVCKDCQHNTVGRFCEKCLPGYYGDSSKGTSEDCRKCECPLLLKSNQFSPTCKLDRDGKQTCDACAVGYSGRDCGTCAPGYTGNPKIPGDKCRISVYQGNLVPKVTIFPKTRVDKKGFQAIFHCRVTGKEPIFVSWSRKDSQPLPSRARVVKNGETSTLTISNLNSFDGVTYTCTAKNVFGIATNSAYLVVLNRKINPIRVLVSPKSLNIHSGATATFRCQARSRVTETLRWVRDGYPKLPEGATVRNGILTLPNVQRRSSGLYTCIGSNQVSVDRASVQLRVGVAVRPQITLLPRQQTVNVDQTATFRCIAIGFPLPRVSWHGPNWKPLPSNALQESNTLEISYIQLANEGSYICKAENNGGTASAKATLYVRAPEKIPKVKISTPFLRVKEGKSIRLVCHGFGTPKPKIVWKHNLYGLVRKGVLRDGILILPRVTKIDEGYYTCIASNVYGNSSDQARLTVTTEQGTKPAVMAYSKKLIVAPGSSVTMQCNISGNPAPIVIWKRHGGILTHNHIVNRNSLLIAKTTIEDTGLYICTGKNIFGTDSASSSLIVQESSPPVVTVSPKKKATAFAGQHVTFVCKVTAGFPTPNVVWVDKYGFPLKNSNNTQPGKSILHFEKVKTLHKGKYYCIANNTVGRTNISLDLNVLGLPRVEIFPKNTWFAVIGEIINIVCKGYGDPLPMVSIQLPNGRELQASRSGYKRISFVAGLKSTGIYNCIGRNEEGISKQEFSLKVFSVKERPVVFVDKASLNISIGENANVTCSATGIPTPILSWFHLPKKGRTKQLSKAKGHELNLLVKKAQIRHSGMYICAATNILGTAEVLVKLQVTGQLDPPKAILLTPRRISVKRGRPLNLLCQGEGFPHAEVKWFRSNGNLSSLAILNKGLLEITSLRVSDAGEYYCEARNNLGFDRKYVRVAVIDPPRILKAKEDTIIARLGDSLSISCNATGSPVPNIEWSRNEITLQNPYFSTLTFSKLRPEDQGQYRCQASNAGGTSHYTVNLKIRELPSVHIFGGISVRTVPIGDPFKAICSGDGEPEPRISWSRVGKQASTFKATNDGLLYIPKVNLSHSGKYRCIVSNKWGSVRSEIALLAQAAPSVTVASSNVVAEVGQVVKLQCGATGVPKPSVHWYKLNGTMPPQYTLSRSNLIIESIRSEYSGTYVCRATNSKGANEGYVKVRVKDFLPSFSSKHKSFLILPKIHRALYKTELEISFKPLKPTGLLLYSGQRNKDFISLGMDDGFVVFQYNLGSGPSFIQSASRLTLYEWHTVFVKRDGLDGLLRVGLQPVVYGKSQGHYTGLNLETDLFIGGIDNYSGVYTQTKHKGGFTGCISRLAMLGKEVDFAKDSKAMQNITNCNSCDSEPCLNGGICNEHAGKIGFTCRCLPGFAGRTCETRIERCFPSACGANGKCIDLRDSGFRCRCPIGRYGRRCSRGKTITTPFFNKTSFLALSGLKYSWQRISLQMTFKPNSKNGILFFYGHTKTEFEGGDFISISLVNGQLQLRFGNGSESAIIQNHDNVTFGGWNTLAVDRYRQFGSIQLNRQAAYKGKLPGLSSGLNFPRDFFIGGHENIPKVKNRIGVTTGFLGCIQEVTMNSRRLHLVTDFVRSHNIKSCHFQISPCDSNPCLNNGECEVVSASSYKCKCLPRFTGTRCSALINRCGKVERCLNGGICTKENPPRCLCQLGYAGKSCQEAVRTDESVYFHGNGFLEYSRNVSNASELNSVQFGVKTTNSNGLLFWHSETVHQPHSNPDFLSIGIKQGKIIVSFELGSGLAVLMSRKRINDGHWHIVHFTRTSRDAVLKIDNDISATGQSSGVNHRLDITAPFFLGGGPNIQSLTSSRFQQGLSGCLSNLIIDGNSILLQTMARGGIGVNPCNRKIIEEVKAAYL